MALRTVDAAVYAAFLVLAILAARHELHLRVHSDAASSASARATVLFSESANLNATAAALANDSVRDARLAEEWRAMAEEARRQRDLHEERAQNATEKASELRDRAERERAEAAAAAAAADEDERSYETDTRNATAEAELEREYEEEVRRRGCGGPRIPFWRRGKCDQWRNKAAAEKEAALAELRAAADARDAEAEERKTAAELVAEANEDEAEARTDDAEAVRERAQAAEADAEATKDEATAGGFFNRSHTESDRAAEKEEKATSEANAASKLMCAATTHRSGAARDRKIALTLASVTMLAFLVRMVVLTVNPLRSTFDYVSAVVDFVRKRGASTTARRTAFLFFYALWRSIPGRLVAFLVLHALSLLLAVASFSGQWVVLGVAEESPESSLSRGSLVVLSSACLAIAAKTAAVAAAVHTVLLDPLPRLCNNHRVEDDGTDGYNARRRLELRAAAEVLFVEYFFLFFLFVMESLILWVAFGVALFGSSVVQATSAPWIYGSAAALASGLRLYLFGFGNRRAIGGEDGRDLDTIDSVTLWPSESELFLSMVDEVLDGADSDRNLATGELLRVFDEIDSTSNDQRLTAETDLLLGGSARGKVDQQIYSSDRDDATGSDGLMSSVVLSTGRNGATSDQDQGRDNKGECLWRSLAVRRINLLEFPFTVLVVACMASVMVQCWKS